jgi:hypothetical protein
MAETVYILCALTCVICVVLLLRGYLRTRARLLLWSCLCFVCLTVNNGLLFIDKVVYPETTLNLIGLDVAVWRTIFAMLGLLLLLVGLIWDSD